MNQLLAIVISFLLSTLIGVSIFMTLGEISTSVAVAGYSFAILSQIFVASVVGGLKRQLENGKREVHIKYALGRLSELRNKARINEPNKEKVIEAISIVEDIIAEISGCCSNEKDAQLLLAKKGFLGSLKTDLDITFQPENIKVICKNIVKETQEAKNILDKM